MTRARLTTLAGRVVRAGVGRIVRLPDLAALPAGRTVELPGRGSTWVVDVAGPDPDAPVVVLLHGLGCTASLCWSGAVDALAERYRVITFDQRWHGRGIRSARFRFADCADDLATLLDVLRVEDAIVVGYSMGGAIAQLAWQRHPGLVRGLVLCSTARNYRGKPRERLFFPLMTATMHPLSRYALARVEQLAAGLPETPAEHPDSTSWGSAEFRSTSAWSFPEVIGELGRFDSASWIGGVDVPTAVVVTERDRTIPTRRQLRLAESIPDARVFTAPGGHASVVLGAERWLPQLQAALDDVAERSARTESALTG